MTQAELLEAVRRLQAQRVEPQPMPVSGNLDQSRQTADLDRREGMVHQFAVPYAEANQLEGEAQPRNVRPQGVKQNVIAGIEGAFHPQGFQGLMREREGAEQQRQQTLLEQVNAKRNRGFQQQQLYQQDQNQQLNREQQQGQYNRVTAMNQEELELAKVKQLLEERKAGQSQAGMGAMGTYYQTGPQAGQIIEPAAAQAPAPRNIDPNSPEGIQARLDFERRKKGLDGGDQPGQLSGLAQAALRDPTILRGLTPTARGAIYNELGKSGQVPPSQFLTVVRRTLDSIQRIKEMPGKSGAIGAKGPMSAFGFKERPFAGSEAGAYRLALDQLKSNLTIPELEMMKGLGHMSDVEFNTIAKAATTLDADQQEKAYDDELNRVEQAMTQIWNRLTGTTAPNPSAPPAAGGGFRIVP